MVGVSSELSTLSVPKDHLLPLVASMAFYMSIVVVEGEVLGPRRILVILG